MNNKVSNLWHSSAQEAEPATLRLSCDQQADLIIIGGGFTGCTAALAAARRGARVVLLEAETIGYGGSGRNVGLANAGLWVPPRKVCRQMGETEGKRLLSALSEGPARVWQLIREESIACEATPNGTLHLAHSARGFKDLEQRYRQGLELGWPIALLDADETARRTGSQAFAGALFDPRAGTLQPLSYARGIARAALNAGAHLYEHCPVQRVSREGDHWLAEAGGYKMRAPALLLATNAYQSGLDIIYCPSVTPAYYFQAASAPLPADLRKKILPSGEGCWDTATVMSSIRMDQAGRMIIGAIGNLESVGKSIHRHWARHKLAELYPQLAGVAFEHDWCGRIAMTDDHIPKIVAFGPNAYACFGYSGRGICPGTVFGLALAEALLDENDAGLPISPIPSYQARHSSLKGIYYETGAILDHAYKGGIQCQRKVSVST